MKFAILVNCSVVSYPERYAVIRAICVRFRCRFGGAWERLRREYVFLTLIYTFEFVLGNKAEWKGGGAGDEENAGRDVKVEAGMR